MGLNGKVTEGEPMPQQEVHQCQCPECLTSESHPDRELHRQMNLLLSRLDEQQRRWYAAVESAKLGHGGDRLVSPLTRPHGDTNPPGPGEMAAPLDDPPAHPGRLPRGGRTPPGKKIP